MSTGTSAVILAAGYSSRLKLFKPLLTLGKTTIIERVTTLFKEAGIEEVRVVVGHNRDELLPVVKRTGATGVVNTGFADGMLSSVITGVESLGSETEAFFILPADIPLVRLWTIRRLIKAWTEQPQKIIHPCFQGKRGHPPLIPYGYSRDITESEGKGGLKAILAQLEPQAIEIEVPDENILFDVDTAADYKSLLDRERRHHVPSRDEAKTILDSVHKRETEVCTHSKAVAKLALRLSTELGRVGNGLDLDLVYAAGLLHDLAKGEHNHAQKGGQVLKEMGYPLVAKIVIEHMDIAIVEDGPVSESEVVYLADKLVQGDQVVSLKERFRTGRERFAHDSDIREAVENRLEIAIRIQERIEKTIGKNLTALLDDLLSR